MKNKTQPEAPQADTALPEAAPQISPALVPAPEATAIEPLPAATTAATGLPIDQYHGRGGTYILHNGVRTLAQ